MHSWEQFREIAETANERHHSDKGHCAKRKKAEEHERIDRGRMTNCIHDHGRRGLGDQLGADRFLTPERTLAALRQVERGEIIDLSHTIEVGAPRMAPSQTPYLLMQMGGPVRPIALA